MDMVSIDIHFSFAKSGLARSIEVDGERQLRCIGIVAAHSEI